MKAAVLYEKFQPLAIEDLELEGRRVLIRVDFNVPLDENQKITDNARIEAALPTIRRIIDSGGKCILMSHLGRPKGKRVESMSLRPAAEELSRILGTPVSMASDCIGPEVEKLSAQLKEGELLLLENLRYHEGETKNDPQFCEALARLEMFTSTTPLVLPTGLMLLLLALPH